MEYLFAFILPLWVVMDLILDNALSDLAKAILKRIQRWVEGENKI